MKRTHEYSKGTGKLLVIFLLSVFVGEGLSLFFPYFLQNITNTVEGIIHAGDVSASAIIIQGLTVFAFIALIFLVGTLTEFLGAKYANRYQANIRKSLYDKFGRLTADQIDQIGVARVIPIIMNDSVWLKNYNRRKWQFSIYFPITILGSFVMICFLNGFKNSPTWMYAVLAFAISAPLFVIFFLLNVRKIGKTIPASIDAYDEYFLNIKEGITGAKDIRILGKAEERSEEFAEHVKYQRRQSLTTDRSVQLSTGFNAILFTGITIIIMLYGAFVSVKTAEDLIILNTVVQYINRIWVGSQQIFTWFVDTIPRTRFTKKRVEKIYAIPEHPVMGGLETFPSVITDKLGLALRGVKYTFQNGRQALRGVSMDIKKGKQVAIAGGIGSGKNVLIELLLRFKDCTDGIIAYDNFPIGAINGTFWRREGISFCSGGPRFKPDTIRNNIKLLAPDATDEQILQTFRELGADDFINKFENFLDFEINESNTINDSTKHLLNIVRAILKPAKVYLFNQCFDHVKRDYIVKLMGKMKKEKRTCVFVTYNDAVCKNCDNIYVLKNGVVCACGAHTQLMQTSADYRELRSSATGNIGQDEEHATKKEPEPVSETQIRPVTVTEVLP